MDIDTVAPKVRAVAMTSNRIGDAPALHDLLAQLPAPSQIPAMDVTLASESDPPDRSLILLTPWRAASSLRSLAVASGLEPVAFTGSLDNTRRPH